MEADDKGKAMRTEADWRGKMTRLEALIRRHGDRFSLVELKSDPQIVWKAGGLSSEIITVEPAKSGE